MKHFEVLAAMTTPQLNGARMSLTMMSPLVPGRDVAIMVIDSELLRRDISDNPRERYVGKIRCKQDLARLAKKKPDVGYAEKEPAMQKTIWYGSTDNNVKFAENQQALASAGIDNPQSFTVTGEIAGLNLVGETSTTSQSQSGQAVS